MATQILLDSLLRSNPDLHACEHCRFWSGEEAVAMHGKSRIAVGQCRNDEDSRAPMVDKVMGDVFVFTPAGAVCPAFELHPEEAEEMVAEADHYHWLDQQLTRDAWM